MDTIKWFQFLAAKGIQIDSSLQHDSALYKNFVEYYASSRYGRIEEFPIAHSVVNMWHRYVGYHRVTKSKIDKNIASDVAGYIEGSLKAKLGLSTKK
ncbi:hypothetical protein V502_00738, partial [Pseudogymnoascus sp. VKM F-4520 (FW-2644)]